MNSEFPFFLVYYLGLIVAIVFLSRFVFRKYIQFAKSYNLIKAANSRAARNGKFLEKLGQYDPNAKEVLKDVKVESVQAWIGKGAQLTDTVKSLFRKHGVKL